MKKLMEHKKWMKSFRTTFNDMPVFKLIARTKGKFTEDMLEDILRRAQ